MAIGSGLGGQFGFVAESTYGTPVTVTRFLEFESESIKANVGAIDSFPMGRGVYQRTARRKHFVSGASGDIVLPVMTKGMNLLFKQMLGASSAAQQGATAEYLHTSQPDANGKNGIMATVQIGRPDVTTPTVQPFTYEGGKVTGWELSCALDGKLMLKVTWDFETENTGVALATPSYSSDDDFFVFSEGALTLAGSAIKVKNMVITGTQPQATNRRFLGNTKLQPIANAPWDIRAKLDFEFEALTRHAAWKAATETTNLIATFDTGEAVPSGDGGNFALVITIPLLVPVNGGQNIGGPDVIMEPIEYKALDDGSNPVIKFENTTTDTAA